MFKNIYKREYYFDKIKGFLNDAGMVKVITGIRRCGKSSFLKSIANHLIENGVNTKDIIYINLDERGLTHIHDTKQLEMQIDSCILDDDFKYLLIDEIQNVKDFEPLINSLRETNNFSIFITGSNSYLLSGELTTKLTGRYIEVEMFTLNFYEYLEMKKFFKKEINPNITLEFENYIRYGGFPKNIEYDDDYTKEAYIKDVIKQIIKKDIRAHKKLRSISVFEKVLTYTINNFGATTNLSNILSYFNNVEKINIKQETLYRYLEIIENAKIIYKCKRFDLRSKKSLRNDQKYYLADLGIYFANNVDSRINYGPVLENILYNYLSSKGYELSIGRIGTLECDFITRHNQSYHYIQVATSIADKNVEDREYKVFYKIKDNYPKYLFTLDPILQKREGIIHENIIDFVTNNKDLINDIFPLALLHL